MQIHLKQLFLEEGKVVPVEGIVPNSEETLWPGHPIGSPIAISGKAANRAGIVTLDYTASFAFVSQCDRCCAPVRRQMSCRFSHLLAEEVDPRFEKLRRLLKGEG